VILKALLRGLLFAFGILAVAMGALWIGQGLGLIMWPASSFMLADKQWAINGAILAAFGLLAIGLARRWPRTCDALPTDRPEAPE
jgi:membrane protein implicated in regulation of membrane protease activity